MVKLLAAGALFLIVLAGCAGSRPVVLSPAPSATADSPAAGLKVHVSLLYSEHVMILAKLAQAAATGSKEDFHAYALLLVAGGDDLAALFGSALGATEGGEFGRIWNRADSDYVAYMTAATTHDQSKSESALTDLTTTYMPLMATFLEGALKLPRDAVLADEGSRVSALKLVMDDAVAANYSAYFLDLRRAYAQAAASGGTIAAQVPALFSDRFPGEATGAAVQRRVDLDSLLQERAYLSSIATAAAVAAARPVLDPVNNMLVANANELTRQLDADTSALFAAQTSSLLAYAAATDDATRQAELAALSGAGATQLEDMLSARFHAATDVKSQVAAEIRVADDQRTKAFVHLGDDDRHAAVLLEGVGDVIALARG